MRKKYWIDYKDLIKDVVSRNRRDDFSLIDNEDQKELALAWLEKENNKKDASELLMDSIILSKNDWIGHFIKGEFKEMTGAILNRFINDISKYKSLNDDLAVAYTEIFSEDFKDPSPRIGGRLNEVL